jgi:hypothetical protein
MKALVLYESMFGNTAAVGEAIAVSLRSRGLEVEAGAIATFEPSWLAEVDLLVVGAPTHAHGMSSKGTRKAAVQDKRYPSAEPSAGPGIRDWLKELPSGSGRLAASFDTRFDKPRWLTGSAAEGIAQRLKRHGYRLVAPPESFFVDNDHKLEGGQVDRATAWAATLAEGADARPA